jgi:hypothetical protein
LISLLQNKLGSTINITKKYALVVDEFHMMSAEHKEQLVSYVQQYGKNIYLIMISNRYDKFDLDLFTRYFVVNSVLLAKCSIPELQLHFTRGNEDAMPVSKRFLSLWARVTRVLFGEEMLSYRFIEKIKKYYFNNGSKESLAEILKEKNQTFTITFCSEFVSQFLLLVQYDKTETNADNNYVSLSDVFDQSPKTIPKVSNLVSLLIRTGLADINENSLSYPEFSVSQIQNYYSFHPVLKIYTWMYYIFSRVNSGEIVLKYKPNILKMLSVYEFFELPGRFPRIDFRDSFAIGQYSLDQCSILYRVLICFRIFFRYENNFFLASGSK